MRRHLILNATIRLIMEKYYPLASKTRIVSLFFSLTLLFSIVLSDRCRAQMGVATGNGVATPAKPLPAGMKPPVVRYEDIAALAGLTGVKDRKSVV